MGDSLMRNCSSCGAEDRVPGKHLAAKGRCGRCKAELPPIAEPIDADPRFFTRVAAEMAGRAFVLKVDADRHPELAERYEVIGIPNFVVLKNGRVVTQQAGLADPRLMRSWLESAAAA